MISSPRVLYRQPGRSLDRAGHRDPRPGGVELRRDQRVVQEGLWLSLKVKPQITPDGRLQLSIEVNKDRPLYEDALLGVPPIETKNVKSEVLIENGGTVVIGGIYEEERSTSVSRSRCWEHPRGRQLVQESQHRFGAPRSCWSSLAAHTFPDALTLRWSFALLIRSGGRAFGMVPPLFIWISGESRVSSV